MPRAPDGRERKLKNFHYLTPDGYILRISALRIPGPNTSPGNRGFWIVKEFIAEANIFEVPSFPQITWGMLEKFLYLGCTKQ